MSQDLNITIGSQLEIGRWQISERKSATGITVNDCRGRAVARVPRRGDDDDLDIARAIVAVPKLISALKEIAQSYPKTDEGEVLQGIAIDALREAGVI